MQEVKSTFLTKIIRYKSPISGESLVVNIGVKKEHFSKLEMTRKIIFIKSKEVIVPIKKVIKNQIP